MPWITKTEYLALLQASTWVSALEKQVADLTERVKFEQERAENAVNMLLVHNGAPPITPQPPPKPEPGLFEDDPDELARLMRDFRDGNVDVLIEEGRGDAK